MADWCTAVQRKLESLFLHGRISLFQQAAASDFAQTLISKVEIGEFEWGIVDAEEHFDSYLRGLGVRV